MEEKKEQKFIEKIKKESEKIINGILEQGINEENLDYLYKVVDIHKDIANEEYWLVKKEDIEMRYRGYSEGYGAYNEGGSYNDGSYGRRGVPGTGRGRYNEGSYGRRGVKGTGRGRYRGEEMMDEMQFHYGNYSEGKEEYSAGNYGAEGETMKALEYMMESVVEFVKMLEQEASSQKEIELIKHYTKKISEM